MHTVTAFPRATQEIEHLEITLQDGCRLAARIWLPRDAEQRPVPAIFEYVPYRKNDLFAWRDALTGPYMAGYGYAYVRVDLRGSGESEGVLRDEYLAQELEDGREVIEWIASQAWCDGAVGMIGISWGGFNALQIAALQPPALKAVITVASTDDRYADDVHYMGGCLLTDNLSWASIMFGRQLFCPPDPRLVGERWRPMWRERLENSGMWLEQWLTHQTRDEYWKHGSICQDYSQIRCPVYAVGGWADGYVNAVFRMLQHLDVPRKGLIGPWAHNYPHTATPGPAIGFLQESLRWWDRWLKDQANGIEEEPVLRAWIQETQPPRTAYGSRPGRWVTEPSWPSSTVQLKPFILWGNGRLDAAPDLAPAALQFSSPLSVGQLGGRWCSYGVPGDLPADQRADDAASLLFETEALTEPLEILGESILDIELESDQPVATLAARLNAVAPDGSSTRVTYGLLNLTHRDNHEDPQPLTSGRRYSIRLPLKHVGERIPVGYKLRLALSTSYWPMAWAPPSPVNLTVHTSNSRLMLAVRHGNAEEIAPDPFPAAEGATPQLREVIEAAPNSFQTTHDLSRNLHIAEVRSGIGTVRFPPIDLIVTTSGLERYTVSNSDPNSQQGEVYWETRFSRGDWAVKTLTETVLSCDGQFFYLRAQLKAFEKDALVFEKSWQRDIPRRLV